jgi:GH25 family lysozyme M1 (1,4-beta-N-acetylmuramidase)
MENIIGPDISFWQDNNDTLKRVDFNQMKSNGAEFIIIRAGQNTWPDQDFPYNWVKARESGLPRGSYWFYDSRADPIEQAQLWIEGMLGDLGELPLWADFEESYGGAWAGYTNWIKFLDTVRSLAPNHEIGIYTGYYYWKEHVPADKRAQFSAYPLWIANYNPGAPLIPEPWASWTLHQYTDAGPGLAFGAESNHIDLNYFNGDLAAFRTRFNLPDSPTVPPPVNTDVSKTTHLGVEVHTVTRFGAKCIIHVINPKIARVYVSNGGFRTVSAAIDKYEADIAFNGGGWPNTTTPGLRANEIWASDGLILQSTAKDDRGYIHVNAQGVPAISKNARLTPGLWNAWGFDRILGENGVFNSKIADRTVKDARTGAGYTADGKLVILSAEGDDRYMRGLSFPEMWAVLDEFGCVIAGNCDGGSSSAVVNTALSRESLIIPSEAGKQSPVINQVLVYAVPIEGNPVPDPEEEPTNGGTMEFKVIKSARFRTQPTVTTNDQGESSVVNTTFESSMTQSDTNNAGTIMVKHPNGKWLPITHLGVEYTRNVTPDPDPEPDPTVPPKVAIDITVTDGEVGSVRVNGIPYGPS